MVFIFAIKNTDLIQNSIILVKITETDCYKSKDLQIQFDFSQKWKFEYNSSKYSAKYS